MWHALNKGVVERKEKARTGRLRSCRLRRLETTSSIEWRPSREQSYHPVRSMSQQSKGSPIDGREEVHSILYLSFLHARKTDGWPTGWFGWGQRILSPAYRRASISS